MFKQNYKIMKISSINNNFVPNKLNSINNSYSFRPVSNFACDTLQIKNKEVSFNGLFEKKKLKKEANGYLQTAQNLKKESRFILGGSDFTKYHARVALSISKNIKVSAKNQFPYFKNLLDNATDNESLLSENGVLKCRVVKQDDKIIASTFDPLKGINTFVYDLDGNLLTYYDSLKNTTDGIESKMKVEFSNGEIVEFDEDYIEMPNGIEKSTKHFSFDSGFISTAYLGYKKDSDETGQIIADECYKYKNNFINSYFKNYSLSQQSIQCSEREFDFEQGFVGPRIAGYKENSGMKNGKVFGDYIYKFKDGKLISVAISQRVKSSNVEEKAKYFDYDENEKPIHFFANGGCLNDCFNYWDESIDLRGLF